MNKLNTLKQQLRSISTSPGWKSAFDNFLDPSLTVLSSTISLSGGVNNFDPITLPAGYRVVGYGIRINEDITFDKRNDSCTYYPQFTISTIPTSLVNSGATADEYAAVSSSNNDLASGSSLTGEDLTNDGGVQGPFYSNEPIGSICFGKNQITYYNYSSSYEDGDGELFEPTIKKGVIVSHFDESWYTNHWGGESYSEFNYWGGYDGASSQAMAPQSDVYYYFKLGFVTLNNTTIAPSSGVLISELDPGDYPLTGKVDGDNLAYDVYTHLPKSNAITSNSTATAYLNIQKII